MPGTIQSESSFDFSLVTRHCSLLFICGCNSMVEWQLPKLHTGVRFSSPAPAFT